MLDRIAALWMCVCVCLPSVVAKEQSARGDEQTDHDGRGRRAGDIVGLLPAHGYRHGEGGFRLEQSRMEALYYERAKLSRVVENRGGNGPATI